MSSFLSNLNILTLSDEEKISCEETNSSEECFRLLEGFQSIKTLGNDGIPVEFYKAFWSLISDSFIKCANECFGKGQLSCSQNQAVITLIENKGKDRTFFENLQNLFCKCGHKHHFKGN